MQRSKEGSPVSPYIVLFWNQKLTSLSRLVASKFQRSSVSVTQCQGSGQAQPLMAYMWVLRTAAQAFVLWHPLFPAEPSPQTCFCSLGIPFL